LKLSTEIRDMTKYCYLIKSLTYVRD